jgi:hypothetical protein
MTKKALLTGIYLLLTSLAFAQISNPEGPYLGQTPPGKVTTFLNLKQS